eukprot:15364009-Heterocapsa_arctica.AAC.1
MSCVRSAAVTHHSRFRSSVLHMKLTVSWMVGGPRRSIRSSPQPCNMEKVPGARLASTHIKTWGAVGAMVKHKRQRHP